MQKYMRYIVGILFLIGMIVLIVIAFNFIRNAISGDPAEKSGSVKKVNLLEAGKAGEPVVFTSNGIIVGEESRRSIRITIDPNVRRIEIIQGYTGQVISSQEYPNTRQGYDTFVSAINGSGFAATAAPKDRTDEGHSCPLGRKYSYEVPGSGSNSFRTWSTSCGKQQGTFAGNNQQVRTLFQRQIPDYAQFVSGTKLG